MVPTAVIFPGINTSCIDGTTGLSVPEMLADSAEIEPAFGHYICVFVYWFCRTIITFFSTCNVLSEN